MKYCSNCGKELPHDDSMVCLHCGKIVDSFAYASNQRLYSDLDAPHGGFTVLGFFIPIAGLILYIVFKTIGYPLKARSAGKGALISVIVAAAFYTLYVLFVLAISFFGIMSGTI